MKCVLRLSCVIHGPNYDRLQNKPIKRLKVGQNWKCVSKIICMQFALIYYVWKSWLNTDMGYCLLEIKIYNSNNNWCVQLYLLHASKILSQVKPKVNL